MVGIARSRGCATCRKRKIACGLERPVCAQCIKSRRECPGYRQYPIFITHKTPQVENNLKPVAGKGAGPPVEKQSVHLRNTLKGFDACPDQPTAIGKSGQVTALFSPDRQVSATPAIRQQLLQEYLHLHLPEGNVGLMRRRMWLLRLPELTYMTSALEFSTMALCLAKLSDVYNDQSLKYESLKLYNHGLHQLQKALWDPELMLHDQTLAACIALATYEMSQCPGDSKNAYISHTRGCETLVKTRGPEAHTEGLGHQIFVHFRIQGVLYALDQKVGTFLSEPAWRETPWRSEPKTWFDRVYGYLALAPGLLRQADMFPHLDIDGQLELALHMIPHCWKMDRELDMLSESQRETISGPFYWPEPLPDDTSSNDYDESLSPVAFHFPNLAIANCVMVHWSVQTMLWHGMVQLYRLMNELKLTFATLGRVEDEVDPDSAMGRLRSLMNCKGDVFDLPPLQHRADFAAPARNILQSVEYCMLDKMVDQGPKIMAAPLRIAIETLRPYPQFTQEVEWGERAMARVQQRSLRLLVYYTGIR
ncbi:hypothetical protein EDD37DRAFT_223036 [Exophiala viscosa]|uniref:uncharacterized protein n=1 Tax=Exophiala viscosa TaxID=2486360 RepID=UPI0021A11812|nr:hypothetical protein EDD37DRAFT_223036 [Exophiala viscosa]